MTDAIELEAFLARLYTDEALRQAFGAAPRAVALAHGLGEATALALQGIDRDGLELAARSLAATRAGRGGPGLPHPSPE